MIVIYIGLMGWGDYDSIYLLKMVGQKKLQVYFFYFLIVELDVSFYVIQLV